MEIIYRRRTVAGRELNCAEQAFPLSSSGSMRRFSFGGQLAIVYSSIAIDWGDCWKRKACCFGRDSVCDVSHGMRTDWEHKAYGWDSPVRCGSCREMLRVLLFWKKGNAGW